MSKPKNAAPDVAVADDDVAVAEKELTDAELIAIEVERMTTRNAEAQKMLDEKRANGEPPKDAQIDKKAMTEAQERMQAAVDLQTGLHATTIKNIIDFRPKNYMVDVPKVLNLYSGNHPVNISCGDDGAVTIIIPPLAA